MDRWEITKIVSGGQTGADRAALDFAIMHGIAHGGWCPLGRIAEDGAIPRRYNLRETPRKDYQQRLEANVRDSDATVVFSLARSLSGGSKRTVKFAIDIGRPWLHVTPGPAAAPGLVKFLAAHEVAVLNIAGSRASKEPTVGVLVHAVLGAALVHW